MISIDQIRLNKEALEIRNNDQVVSNQHRKLLNGKRVSENIIPILMVPQFWIWKFGDHILSACSFLGKNSKSLLHREIQLELDGGLHYDPENIYNAHGYIEFERWKRENIRLSTCLIGSDHRDLNIGLLLADQIDKFGKAQTKHKFQSPLDIFETGVVQIMSDVDKYMTQSSSATLDIDIERKFIHDSSDVRSELAMISEILHQQEEILKSFIDRFNAVAKKNFLWRKVPDACQQLERYRKKLRKIDRDTERIEKTI